MKLKVQYGCGVQEVTVPDTCKVEVLEGSPLPGVDQKTVITDALAHPLGPVTIDRFLKDGKLLIIVNDGDRPTPTPRILGPILGKIKDRPDTKIIVACGTHRVPNEEDLDFIFGDLYKDLKDMVFFHQSKDKASLVRFGKTRRGNEVYMNKLVQWADKLLITGSVEPHYFAGFTGGRKWVIGVGGFETIERNHKLAITDAAAPLALKGNPLAEELAEWDQMVDKPKFCINVVQDSPTTVGAAFAGDIDKVFEAAVKVGTKLFSAPIKSRSDIVLTVSRAPMDSDLYQALKAQEHGKLAMKDGGILILVAQCKRGLGPQHFKDVMQEVDNKKLMKNIETNFKLGQHKIAKFLNTMMRGKVWVVTDLCAQDIQAMKMERFATVQQALDKALSIMGPTSKIAFLPDGGMIVPRYAKVPGNKKK
jgi:lactate racemase